MPEYQFRGRNQQGELQEGKRIATSEGAVATLLTNEGLIPVHIQEVKAQFDPIGAINKRLTQRKVRLEDLIMFCRQMYTMTKSGIPVTSAVARLAETTHSSTMR